MKVLVGIVMGSAADTPIMEGASKVLSEFHVPFDWKVLSAHRMPELVAQYARGAQGRGVKAIIAGAGMAAHLAGAVAAHTTLPVIGVPIVSGGLGGLDALLSTVQMPTGVPVATVAINGASNAAFLALEILALGDSDLSKKLKIYRENKKKSLLKENKNK